MSNDRPRLGIVLGAGGTKGWAHVGVLKVLHDSGLPIDLVVGASAGALMAPLYAARRDAEEMVRIAAGVTPTDLLEWFLCGLRIGPDGGRFGRTLWEAYGRLSFAELAVPTAIIGLDLATGERVVLREGQVGQAVQASITPPVIVGPVRLGQRHLVDGGLHNTVPVDVAYALGADRVIAVNVGEFLVLPTALRPLSAHLAQALRRQDGQPHSLRGQMAFMAQLLSLERAQRPAADVLIRPNLAGLGALSPWTTRLAIERGEQAARAALPLIGRVLALDTSGGPADRSGRRSGRQRRR